MASVTDAVIDHYVAKWGPASRTAHFDHREGYSIHVLKWAADAPGNHEEVALYATAGASEKPMKGGRDPMHRIELLIGLVPEQDGVAGALASLADYPSRHRTFLDHGHTVLGQEPLWPGTGMTSVVVVEQTNHISPLVLPNKVHVEVLLAVPLYPSELELKKRIRFDAFWERFLSAGVPFERSDRSAWSGFG